MKFREFTWTALVLGCTDHAPAMRGKCSGEGKWEIFLSDFLWFSGLRFPYLTRASASNLPRSSSRQVSFAATVEKNEKFTFQRLVSTVSGTTLVYDWSCWFRQSVWCLDEDDFWDISQWSWLSWTKFKCDLNFHNQVRYLLLLHSITITASGESFEF